MLHDWAGPLKSPISFIPWVPHSLRVSSLRNNTLCTFDLPHLRAAKSGISIREEWASNQSHIPASIVTRDYGHRVV